jgi:ABC-type multidrug transport system ATPase subunit
VKKECAIKVSHVYKKNKAAKNINIVKDINFEIPEGSIMGLIGPSGAGKSTLYKILALTSNRTSGIV